MQQTTHRNLIWKGYEYASTEHCSITITEQEILINGQIKSRPKDLDLRITYGIVLNRQWETCSVKVAGRFEKQIIDFDFRRTGSVWTNWDGLQLEGGTDPDISLSPLTNTLPIRRLNLATAAGAGIDVLYLDLENNKAGLRKQRYTRLSGTQYRFETAEGYEALITVDEAGFVVTYPELFERA